MFEQPFGLMHHFNSSFSSFKVDVKDMGATYELTAELPGVKKEEITLDYNQNYLTISANRNEENETKENNYICRERHVGNVQSSFYLDNIDRDKTVSYTHLYGNDRYRTNTLTTFGIN